MIVHATLVARSVGGRWRGVLLRGASGAGKSDLALRLIEAGWRLAADDRVRLWLSGGALYGRAPETLAGLLEVRGQGVLACAAPPFTRVALVADACATPERLPEASTADLLGVRIPRLDLAFLEPSAPARLERALLTAVASRTAR